MGKHQLLAILIIALSSSTVLASDSEEEDRAALVKSVKKKVAVYNKALKRETNPGKKADILADLKADLMKIGATDTSGLSDKAIELYKKQERISAEGLDPIHTPIECFEEMDHQAYQEYYLHHYGACIVGHERLLRMTSMALLYRKIGDVYAMDKRVTLADNYFMRAAHVIVDGLYDYSEKSYLCATMRWVSSLLKMTTDYEDSAKPLVSWALDTFKARNKALADKIFDMAYVSEIEPVTSSNLFAAAYYSLLLGDLTFAQLYHVNAMLKMDHEDPMLDSNVGSRAERFSNAIMMDLLDVLLQEGKLGSVNRALNQKWHSLLVTVSPAKTFGHKKIETPLGTLSTEDMNNVESLYKRVRRLHHVNLVRFE